MVDRTLKSNYYYYYYYYSFQLLILKPGALTVFLSWLPVFPSAGDVQLWWMCGWCTRFFRCLLSITSNDIYIYIQKYVLFDIRLLMRLVYIYI